MSRKPPASAMHRPDTLKPGMSIRYPWIFDKRVKQRMTLTRVMYRPGHGYNLVGTAPDGRSVTYAPHENDLLEVVGNVEAGKVAV